MRTDEQTSKHLLLAAIITVCSVMLILMTVIMEWELWMVPLIEIGRASCRGCSACGFSTLEEAARSCCMRILAPG